MTAKTHKLDNAGQYHCIHYHAGTDKEFLVIYNQDRTERIDLDKISLDKLRDIFGKVPA